MRFIVLISDFIIPVTFLMVIAFGYTKGVDIFQTFIEGAKEGLKVVVDILPTLIGLMLAVSILRASGVLDIIVILISPITEKVGFPAEVVPLSLMRLVSSSAATGMLIDIFDTFGPDSFIGRLASVMMGCTETIFYTMSVYFMSIGIKKTGYTLRGALIANIAGVIASAVVVKMVF